MINWVFYLTIFNTIINIWILWYVISNESSIRSCFDSLSNRLSIIYRELSNKIEKREQE